MLYNACFTIQTTYARTCSSIRRGNKSSRVQPEGPGAEPRGIRRFASMISGPATLTAVSLEGRGIGKR